MPPAGWKPGWEKKRRSGRRRSVTAWIRNYGLPRVLYTDWKNVTNGKRQGRNRCGANSADAVWTHVPEAGHSDHRRQYAPGQGAGGAEPRDPSGSADQETGGGKGSLATKPPTSSEKRISAAHNRRFAVRPHNRRTITVASRRSGTPWRSSALETERGISNDWVKSGMKAAICS